MEEIIFEPSVNPSREFLEIASDFSNPLDIVREAISNSFDAKADEIYIFFNSINIRGIRKLQIILKDNGSGMDMEGVKSFFDLGNSLRRDAKEIDTSLIGEKGHGTKIYFNSEFVNVKTAKDGIEYTSIMKEPLGSLYEGEVPKVSVTKKEANYSGTVIEILGYNNNERSIFNHDRLKDYIYWFTKFGSFENQLYPDTPYKNVKLFLKGLDVNEPEELHFGHKFLKESEDLTKLFNEYMADAPDYYVKKFVFEGTLNKFPDIEYQAVFYIEGNKAKRQNPMVRRSGYTAPNGAYTVQERYGIWLSKDFIPVQRKNEWVTNKGSEYTKFHAFFNCQDLKLTANRGSIDNTQAEILEAIEEKVKEIYNKITDSSEWSDLEYLEQESSAFQSEKKEEKNYLMRKKHVLQNKTVEYQERILREPRQEHGVFALYHTLDILKPDLFPFEIVDYDTHAGIDVLARLKKASISLERDALHFIEFKYILKNSFNHSFERLFGIVCYKTQLKNNDTLTDAFGKVRTFRCIPKDKDYLYTKYYLENEREGHRIEVIVLEEFIYENLNLVFQKNR